MKKKDKRSLPVKEAAPELTVEAPRPEPTQYYIDLAHDLKITKLVLIIFLVVFLLSMIMIFRKDITVENYRYLIRLYTSSESSYTGNYQAIYYDSSGATRLGMFHGDLAVLKKDGVTLYNMRGDATMDQSVSYADPALITGGKYMLTYDIGGSNFDLFNNFSRLSGETFDYPISTAAVSPEGMYAVVTKSLEYQSVVHLYDHNFKLLTRISKDKYVMSVALTDDGSELLIVSSYTKDGSFNTEIMTYEPYTDTAKSSDIRTGAMGVTAGYHADGSYTVLCTDAILFYDADDNLVSTYYLGGITPNKCVIGEDCTLITYNRNAVGSATAVMVFTNDGAELLSTNADEKVVQAVCRTDKIFLLCTGKLVEIDRASGEVRTAPVDSGASALFSADENTLIVGYSNMVKAYAVEDLFGEKKSEETDGAGGETSGAEIVEAPKETGPAATDSPTSDESTPPESGDDALQGETSDAAGQDIEP